MCGIAGFITNIPIPAERLYSISNAIRKVQNHRGPDDNGIWISDENDVTLIHNRLSIIDLSSTGHQPMCSRSGRYVIVFNGEIYNFTELKTALEKQGAKWRGHSDTEIILAGFENWGIEETIRKMVGMFAIALWDKAEKKLTLIRDRAGEKPLYYGRKDNTIMFASELKAFVAHPEFRLELNQDVVATYLRYGYIPSPHSIYRNIYKLLPGSYLQIDHKSGNKIFRQPVKYWSLGDFVSHQTHKKFLSADEATVVNELDTKLQESISLQKVADVPLGAFLSGGIDSSTIVALMQNQSSRPIQTFTIGFNEKMYDEAKHSKNIAQHLGTDHSELYVSSDDARNVIPDLPHMFDEPFGDSSAIPTFLVSKLARSKVTVSLSGDAGDELFGGYSQYINDAPLWDKIKSYPGWLRRPIGSAMLLVGTEVQYADPEDYYKNALRKKLKNYGRLLTSKDIADFYAFNRSIWPDAEKISLTGEGVDNVIKEYLRHPSLDGTAAAMMYADANTYLPDDILTKVDRAAMAVSLETRVPMLDHRIMEFAFALPTKFKIRNGQGKWILRQVLKKYVPDRLVDRPKMGFGVPVEDWLNGSLHEWAGDLLSYDLLKKQGIFDADAIASVWKQQQAGIKGQSSKLWLVLSFQAWLQTHKKYFS